MRQSFLRSIWNRRRSVVLGWLFSYLAVLLLPIAITGIVYRESSQALHGEIQRANEALLQQLKTLLDNQYTNMQRLSTELAWNTRVQSILDSGQAESKLLYESYMSTRDMKTYHNTLGAIDDFYIYWAAFEQLILPGVMYDTDFGYNLLHSGSNLTREQWNNLLQSHERNRIVTLPWNGITGNDGTSEALALITPLTRSSDQPVVGSVVVMVDTKRLMSSIRSIELFNSGDIYVLDANNRLLLSTGTSPLPSWEKLPELTGDSAAVSRVTVDGDLEVYAVGAAGSKLKVVSVIPDHVYWGKATQVRRFTYISIGVSVAGGCILTFIFLRRHYTPVRRLVEQIVRSSPDEERYGVSELTLIGRAYDRTLNEREQLLLWRKQQDKVLRSHMLSRLLKGKYDGKAAPAEALARMSIQVDSRRVAVLLFYFEEMDEYAARMADMDIGEQTKLLHFIVANVVEEIVGRRYAGYVCEVDDALACLVTLEPAAHADEAAELKAMSREAQAFLRERYAIGLTAAISSVHATIAGIPHAYSEAAEALSYKLVYGKHEVLAYSDIPGEDGTRPAGASAAYDYPLQTERQWINTIKAGDYDGAVSILQEIMDRNFSLNSDRPALSVPLARCLLFDLVGTIIRSVNELGDLEQTELLRPRAIDQILACESVQEMRERLSRLLREVTALAADRLRANVEDARQRSVQDLTVEIRRYIEANYHDLELSVTAIADKFEMRSTYLSKLFKDQTGDGLLEYINRTRIERAKSFLLEARTTIADAARLVGFGEVSTFIRVFKKYEGITPGKFKEIEG